MKIIKRPATSNPEIIRGASPCVVMDMNGTCGARRTAGDGTHVPLIMPDAKQTEARWRKVSQIYKKIYKEEPEYLVLLTLKTAVVGFAAMGSEPEFGDKPPLDSPGPILDAHHVAGTKGIRPEMPEGWDRPSAGTRGIRPR